MGRLRYFAGRTVTTVFLIWAVITFLFFFFRLMPGSFTDIMMTRGASPETIAAFNERWGLNDPLHVQYVSYLRNLFQADLGSSLRYQRPVWDVVQMRLFNSFILVAPAVTFAYLFGSIYGTIAGLNRGSFVEKYGILPIIFLGSFPSFVIAIYLIIVFAGWLNLFPTGGLMDPQLQFELQRVSWWRPYTSADFAWHYILPFSAVVLRYLYFPSLLMRTNVVEVTGQPFIFYHRITGLPRVKRLAHVAKHASLPVITMYPISITRAVGGLVLIETVFNWPGIGHELIAAVLSRDFPVVMFVFFLIAVFVIVANYVVDVLYGIIDPRISVSG